MMPELDGIETTKRMRQIGYDCPIVALTANAVAGQAEIFLKNGFDDFISKPIDIHRLDAVLHKLIRDKQPQEVIDAAQQQVNDKKTIAESASQMVIDPDFAAVFAQDAAKSLAALDAIVEKGAYDEHDLRSYTIYVHGMKSALANIGKMALSDIAKKLEQSGRDSDIAAITSETPAFLRSLRTVVEELTPKEEEDDKTVDNDEPYLREKLLAIIAACKEYDQDAVHDALEELKEKTWSRPTRKLLGVLAISLLHSDFDAITDTIDKFLETKSP